MFKTPVAASSKEFASEPHLKIAAEQLLRKFTVKIEGKVTADMCAPSLKGSSLMVVSAGQREPIEGPKEVQGAARVV